MAAVTLLLREREAVDRSFVRGNRRARDENGDGTAFGGASAFRVRCRIHGVNKHDVQLVWTAQCRWES